MPSWGCACFSSIPPAAELFWNSGFNFLQEWKEIVKRDRNHPSIITWTPANESCTSNSYNHRYRQFIDNCFEILPRQALHAGTIGFIHPRTHEKVTVSSGLPADMTALIEKFRNFVSSRQA